MTVKEYFGGRCPYTDNPCEEWKCLTCPVNAEERKWVEECEIELQECGDEMKDKDAVKYLDQIENLLAECEKGDPDLKMPTMKAFLMLARVVYFLLEERVKNNFKKN